MKRLYIWSGLWVISTALWAQAALSDGEVSKVDGKGGRITLKHGEIKHLDLPPMTMTFVLSNPAVLARLQAGDKVKFRAEKIDGRYTVTQIEVAN